MEMPARGALEDWLKAKCRTEGWSTYQAASKTGLSHTTISKIGGHVSADTVIKLAQAFEGDGNERLALEDAMLVLAGHRTR